MKLTRRQLRKLILETTELLNETKVYGVHKDKKGNDCIYDTRHIQLAFDKIDNYARQLHVAMKGLSVPSMHKARPGASMTDKTMRAINRGMSSALSVASSMGTDEESIYNTFREIEAFSRSPVGRSMHCSGEIKGVNLSIPKGVLLWVASTYAQRPYNDGSDPTILLTHLEAELNEIAQAKLHGIIPDWKETLEQSSKILRAEMPSAKEKPLRRAVPHPATLK